MSVARPSVRAPGPSPRSAARLPATPSIIVSGLISDWADPSTTVELTPDEIAALTTAANTFPGPGFPAPGAPSAVIDREITEPFAYAGLCGAYPIVRLPDPPPAPLPAPPMPLPAPSGTEPGPTTAALDPVPWAHVPSAAPSPLAPPPVSPSAPAPPHDHFLFVVLFLICLLIALLTWGVLLL